SDLVVIAAQSRHDHASRLGTTAGQVIARTHVPVIVVRDPGPWLAFTRTERPLKILLGIDDSATCDLGTTAGQVIARTHVPVIVVRDPGPWLAFTRTERPLKILLGIDDSATCDL